MNPSRPTTDDLAELLARVALGDSRAFQRLYERSSAKLMGLVVRIQPQRAIAEEVLQETFVAIWQRAAEYQTTLGNPMTWMGSIARHRAIDSLRRDAARPQGHLVHPTPDEDGDDEAMLAWCDRLVPQEQAMDAHHPWPDRGRLQAIETCLGQLPSAQRQGVVLAYIHGLTHAELAQQLRAPLGSVKTWVRRGLQALKNCLQAFGGERAL